MNNIAAICSGLVHSQLIEENTVSQCSKKSCVSRGHNQSPLLERLQHFRENVHDGFCSFSRSGSSNFPDE